MFLLSCVNVLLVRGFVVAATVAGLLLCGCGDGHNASQLDALVVTPRTASIVLGQAVQLKATGFFSNGDMEDVTDSVSWQSADTGVATISANGLASSVSAGKINLTARMSGFVVTTPLVISKAALESLTVTPPSPTIILGQSAQLTAMGVFSDKTAQDLSSIVNWSSAQPGIAAINTAGLTASKTVGTATITATLDNITASNQITVSPAALVSIAVRSANPTTPLGTKMQFTAQGVYTDGSNSDITNSASWTSAPAGFVAVSSTGLAATKATGNVTVTATSGAISGVGMLTVSPAALVSIAVQSPSASVPLGTKAQFSAQGTYTDASTADITNTATWTSIPAGIVSVGVGGLAAAKTVGNATITATSSGISGAGKLTVSSSTLVSIAVQGPSASVPLGMKSQFAARGTYTDGSTADITNTVSWTSVPAGVANVSAAGLAVTKSVGNATVTATSGTTTGSGKLTVSPAALVAINIGTARSTLPLGSTQQFSATGGYTDGSTQDLTSSVQWASSSPSVVAVNSTGLATAKTIGATNVLASSGSVAGTAGLNVSAAALTSINISPVTPTVPLGSNLQIMAIGSYTDGSTQDVTPQITWSIDKPDIASITSGGVVTGQQVGVAGIGASVDSVQTTATLTVQPLLTVGYFSVTPVADTTMRITNPASTAEDLCAMVYVFDQDQQMSECCGCYVSRDGLRTFSLNKDLLSNPLTGVQSKTGTVMLVSADYSSNLSCNASSITPKGTQIAWSTHLSSHVTGQAAETEDAFSYSPLSATLSSALQAQCAFIQQLGGGQGQCGCGSE